MRLKNSQQSGNVVKKERAKLLSRIESFFEMPMVILGFIWLILLVIDLINGSKPWMEKLSLIIWVIFIFDFVIKFVMSPAKAKFIRSNIVTMISLAVPAFRVFRVVRMLRILRISRSLRLVKILGSVNRGMRALSITMQRRAFGYVLFLTLIVILAGSAGMYAFENEVPGGLNDYGTSLWWTTMLMTTIGSEYWPHTMEGRILCIFLSIFAFAVFGYITATIATFFIGRDAADSTAEIAGSKQIIELQREIQELRKAITTVLENNNRQR